MILLWRENNQSIFIKSKLGTFMALTHTCREGQSC